MSELELYKYINNNNIEWRKYGKDVLIFPNYSQIEEFNKLLSPDAYDDDGIECVLRDGYITINMTNICEYQGIELWNIFVKEI